MNLGEHSDELRELQKAGVLEIEQTRDGRQINFTEPGKELTEMQIAWNEDMQLFLFDLYWSEKYGDIEGSVEKLFKIAEDLKEDPGINILRTIEFNQEKLHGIEFTDQLPEELLQQFDPETGGENQE